MSSGQNRPIFYPYRRLEVHEQCSMHDARHANRLEIIQLGPLWTRPRLCVALVPETEKGNKADQESLTDSLYVQ